MSELSDYKESVTPTMNASLEWQRDGVFTATTARGYDLDFDSANEWGCMPLESLMMSLAGCMAIDVVSILTRMRCPPSKFRMDIIGERRIEPPQRLKSVEMVLHLSGENLEDAKIQRAIALSAEKYCSVRHSLREDIEIKTRYIIESEKPE